MLHSIICFHYFTSLSVPFIRFVDYAYELSRNPTSAAQTIIIPSAPPSISSTTKAHITYDVCSGEEIWPSSVRYWQLTHMPGNKRSLAQRAVSMLLGPLLHSCRRPSTVVITLSSEVGRQVSVRLTIKLDGALNATATLIKAAVFSLR